MSTAYTCDGCGATLGAVEDPPRIDRDRPGLVLWLLSNTDSRHRR